MCYNVVYVSTYIHVHIRVHVYYSVLQNGTCRFSANDVVATDSGYVKIPQADEQVLLDAVYRIGPISVAMDASMNDFRVRQLNYYT